MHEPNDTPISQSREHNAAGLFIGGPQLAQPHWYRVVASGNMPESDESADNVRSRQRHERKQRVRRIMRLQTATSGARVGRNSSRSKAA